MTRSPWMVLGVVVGFAASGAAARAQQVVDALPLAQPVSIPAPGAVVGPVVAEGAAGPSYSSPIPGVPIVAAPGVGGTALGSGSVAPFAGSRSGAIMPYSYYANFPEPARVYVGYGANDGFPFRGNFYGHSGDRWSWAAMSTGNNSLARYYYQILP